MESVIVNIRTINSVKEIVSAASMMPVDVKAGAGRYEVDAKSIMGMLSLNLLNPIRLTWDDKNKAKTADFMKFLQKCQPLYRWTQFFLT